MTAIMLALILISINHIIDNITEHSLGYDTLIIDICIGIGYLLYMFL